MHRPEKDTGQSSVLILPEHLLVVDTVLIHLRTSTNHRFPCNRTSSNLRYSAPEHRPTVGVDTYILLILTLIRIANNLRETALQEPNLFFFTHPDHKTSQSEILNPFRTQNNHRYLNPARTRVSLSVSHHYQNISQT
jgi:hypothetical protein